MKYLLDTQIFLWLAMRDENVPGKMKKALENLDNEVFFSAVSAWEIGIKCGLGKLVLPGDALQFVPAQVAQYQFTPLPISLIHGLAVKSLPAHHRDPFDRLLIAQAQIEGLILMTVDRVFEQYPVRIWRN